MTTGLAVATFIQAGALKAAEQPGLLSSPLPAAMDGAQDSRIAQVEIPANPEMPAAPSPTLQFRENAWTVTIGLFTGSQLVLEDNTFWGLSEVFAPTAYYNPDRVWNEAWLIPSLRLDVDLAPALRVYGAVAPAATGTLGSDLFEQGNAGEISLENAFGGFRLGGKKEGFTLDVSGGQQSYRLGTGFLLDLGAQNGNSRGALLVAPRRAWKSTAIARFSSGRLAADAFLLDFNEITSSDPDTRLWGTKLELGLTQTPSDQVAGIAYVQVTDSTMPYISAPLTIIENGRQGTQAINPYLRLRPLRRSLPGLYAALEGAYEWNNGIALSAWGLSAEVGHQWQHTPLMPRLSYAFRQYSGDNPRTATLERFDPLFYDGGVYAFASGSNAALTFYNTNVLSHRLALSLSLSPKDLLTLSYWRVSAAQLNSPLQFGQGGRLVEIGSQPVLISGVPAHHLSDDLYLEYVRSLLANTYLTLGIGVSFPGKGLMQAGGGTLDTWLGGLVNLTVKF